MPLQAAVLQNPQPSSEPVHTGKCVCVYHMYLSIYLSHLPIYPIYQSICLSTYIHICLYTYEGGGERLKYIYIYVCVCEWIHLSLCGARRVEDLWLKMQAMQASGHTKDFSDLEVIDRSVPSSHGFTHQLLATRAVCTPSLTQAQSATALPKIVKEG